MKKIINFLYKYWPGLYWAIVKHHDTTFRLNDDIVETIEPDWSPKQD